MIKAILEAFRRLQGRFDFQAYKKAEAKKSRANKAKRPPKRRRRR